MAKLNNTKPEDAFGSLIKTLSSEEIESIEEDTGKLSKGEIICLKMALGYSLSYEELAAIFGMTPSGARRLEGRAMRKIQEGFGLDKTYMLNDKDIERQKKIKQRKQNKLNK